MGRSDKVLLVSEAGLKSTQWQRYVERAKAIAERQGGWFCYYTGVPLVPAGEEEHYCIKTIQKTRFAERYRFTIPDDSPYHFFNIDHLIPVSLDGGDELENLVLVSVYENKARSNRSVKEYMSRKIESVGPVIVGIGYSKWSVTSLALLESYACYHRLTRNEAIRLALREEATVIRNRGGKRSRVPAMVTEDIYAAEVAGVTTTKLNANDMETIDFILDHVPVRSRAAAVRYAIYHCHRRLVKEALAEQE